MISPEVFRSAGVLPTGPVSAWPEERHNTLMETMTTKKATKVKASAAQMAKGALQVAAQGARAGAVSKVIREERYSVCKTCPFFLADTKRCSECGCFMEAKTWINGDPDTLCPKQLWAR